MREPGTDRFRDQDAVERVETVPGLIFYLFYSPIFFSNVEVLRHYIRRLVSESDPPFLEILFYF